MDGDERILRISWVRLNEYNRIVVIYYRNEEREFVPDEWTHGYLKMYRFVADNLKYAKKEPSFLVNKDKE